MKARAAAVGALVVATLVVLRAVGPFGSGLLLFGLTLWFVSPGVLVARRIYGSAPGARVAVFLIGPIWGFALSSLALLGLWVAGLRGPLLLILPPLLGSLAWFPAGPLAGALTPPHFTRRDVTALLILLIVVPLVVGRPFSRVGQTLPDGRAYRAYFTADFVWRMAVVAEVSKGDLPPHNQFYRGDELRYYWLPHLLPAVEYRLGNRQATLEQILLVNSLVLDLAFLAFLYGFVRQYVASPPAAALGAAGAVLFTSFEGAERLYALWQEGGQLESLRYLNIDAISRWVYRSLPVDGLHRLLLYQPHHAMGYAIGLSALLALDQAREPSKPELMTFLGCLLGACLLLSTFSAIMITIMVAVAVLTYLVPRRAWRAIGTGAALGALPLLVAVFLAFALQYVDRAGSLVRILVNPMAARSPVTALTLSFGPMLIGALAGAALAFRRRAWPLATVGIIVAVAFLFYFFVDVRDHQYVYVGWRAGHLLFVAFAALTGFAIQELAAQGRRVRGATIVTGAVLALAAAPTIAIDLYNTQDVANRELGPGFRWTLMLTPDEIEALDWIKRSTRPDAIVQVEPHVRDAFTWAYVPAFAERRMAAGIPISMVPLDKYLEASGLVRDLYQSSDPEAAFTRAAKLRIDYLVIGPPEREAYPGFGPMLDEHPELFRPMFRNNSMAIYFVDWRRRRA